MCDGQARCTAARGKRKSGRGGRCELRQSSSELGWACSPAGLVFSQEPRAHFPRVHDAHSFFLFSRKSSYLSMGRWGKGGGLLFLAFCSKRQGHLVTLSVPVEPCRLCLTGCHPQMTHSKGQSQVLNAPINVRVPFLVDGCFFIRADPAVDRCLAPSPENLKETSKQHLTPSFLSCNKCQ